MDNAHFIRLFGYELWANERLLIAISAAANVHQDGINIFSHVINAHEIWLSRIQYRNAQLSVWQILEFEEMSDWMQENHDAVIRLLAQNALTDEISYSDTKGNPHHSVLADILTHMLMHSTHHRGQVIRMLRESGVTPPAIDYIVYTRSLA